MIELSVIICSYNRYDLAVNAASAVTQSESFDSATIELIVVDNTPRKVRRSVSFGQHARVEICDTAGLSHARNAGIGVARGNIVAFIDDDAIVGQTWCSSVLSAFERFPRAKACGGKTIPKFSIPARPRWYYDELNHYLSCIDWGPKAHPLDKSQWIVGANMAFRREVFEEIGVFDPALGRSGEGSLLSNEEIAILRKLKYENVYYVPDMEVQHIIPESRVTLSWFRKRVFWQAVSDIISGDVYLSRAEAEKQLFNITARAPAEYRGHRLYSYEPRDADEMKDQLNAIYAITILFSAGMTTDFLKE